MSLPGHSRVLCSIPRCTSSRPNFRPRPAGETTSKRRSSDPHPQQRRRPVAPPAPEVWASPVPPEHGQTRAPRVPKSNVAGSRRAGGALQTRGERAIREPDLGRSTAAPRPAGERGLRAPVPPRSAAGFDRRRPPSLSVPRSARPPCRGRRSTAIRGSRWSSRLDGGKTQQLSKLLVERALSGRTDDRWREFLLIVQASELASLGNTLDSDLVAFIKQVLD